MVSSMSFYTVRFPTCKPRGAPFGYSLMKTDDNRRDAGSVQFPHSLQCLVLKFAAYPSSFRK